MTVAPDAPGFYHCMSRCVRQAWLCGEDPVTGRNYDHRRGWIEHRLVDLAESFAVGLYAWAVMSNHTHVVLRVDPRQPWAWSDLEVARRWVRLRQTPDATEQPPERRRRREAALLGNPERLEVIRHRLGSLSWFMRFLNEGIARQANAEDGCTGRFWEGRFQCQALLDEPAVLACMTYVDLNPIRAGLCDRLIDSDFTAIQRRLRALGDGTRPAASRIRPLAGQDTAAGPLISEQDYIELVDWSGRIARPDKPGRIPADAPPTIVHIRGSPQWWTRCVLHIQGVFGSAVGAPRTLQAHARATGRRWLQGTSVQASRKR